MSKKQVHRVVAFTAAVLAGACLAAGPFASPAAAMADRDGDGLPDVWETRGVDTNGDGRIDLDLPAMGADPDRKDVFVEMDYMRGLLPSTAELDRIVKVFADLPVPNPDGSTGITLHLDGGPAAGGAYDLGGGNEVPYRQLPNGVRDVTELRRTNSARARNNVFHYMVWGDSYGSSGSSGQGQLNGLDFLVTVGPRYWRATPENRIGTFIHELGHNLNLHHGGDEEVNWKPNYLSIMNYAHQLVGVPRTDDGRYFGYSTAAYATLDESRLDERTGAGPRAAGFDMYWYIGDTRYRAPADGPVDYNRNGRTESSLALDINRSGNRSQLRAPNDLQRLLLDVRRKGDSYRRGAEQYSQSEPEIVSNELTAEVAERYVFNQPG